MILLLLGPSGSGKKAFKLACKNYGIRIIKSCTTKPQSSSKDDEVYRHITDAQFDSMILNDEMLEWVEYNNYKYGTLRSDFTKNCVTIVDKSAMYKLQSFYAGKVFSILFDMSEELCKKRCLERGEELSAIEQKIMHDKLRFKNLDRSSINLILHDSDIDRFDEIIKENVKKWVVR